VNSYIQLVTAAESKVGASFNKPKIENLPHLETFGWQAVVHGHILLLEPGYSIPPVDGTKAGVI